MTGEVKITWDPTPNLGMDELDRVTNVVRKELLELDLDRPEDLFFHNVFLTGDYEGASVLVFGRKGSDSFHATYHETTEWVSISKEIDDDA